MAISRIGGRALKSNLERDSDLTFNTDTLAIDYTNNRIGIGTTTPTSTLDVTGSVKITGSLTVPEGNAEIDSIRISGNKIESKDSNANLHLDTSGTGYIDFYGAYQFPQTRGTAGQVLKVDGSNGLLIWDDGGAGGISINTGMDVPLGTPTDSDLVTGAYTSWTTATKVTDAIDDLNEVLENVRNNTYVKSVTFTASVLRGGAGFSTQLNISAVGNPNEFVIDWGDGTSNTTTSSTRPTHQYYNYLDAPHSITVTARHTGGNGSGSSASFQRVDYISTFTPDPTVGFAAYAASSGGSPITSWDDGSTIYFQNNSTNTDISGATVQFTWDWGDSQADSVVSADNAAGGSSGSRIAHTFDTATEQEQQFTVTLTLNTMSTCDETVIPQDTSANYKIYDTHTPTFTQSSTSGINEASSSGHSVTFSNTTETTIGNYGTYGLVYQWQFGDGNSTNANVGTGVLGDTGTNISHTYTLSNSDQANGIAQDYTGTLRVISSHTSSPFVSSNFTVHIEPDVRASVSGSAVTTSDSSSDNNSTIYDHTDYQGTVRSIVTASTTSQNADDYVYDWGDGSTNDTPLENGTDAGSIGNPITHNYAGTGTGTKALNLTANGTPDITLQNATASTTYTLKAVPSAPAGLSTKSITLTSGSVGTSPKLAYGFTDNSSTNPMSAGDSLSASTKKRMTSGNVITSSVNDVYDGISGTLSADINGSDDGTKTFTTSIGETGTFSSLQVTQQVDVHSVNGSYPSYFYQVFDARIGKSVADLPTGVSDFRLKHTATGNTNYVSVMKDNMTSIPSFGSVGTISAGTNGTFRYISGIPYYNSGSPTINITGMTINNLVGQAYTNQSNIVEVDSSSNYEGTSSSAISSRSYTYTDIDGATTMLQSGIPKVNIGITSAYAIGSLSIPITTSSVRTIDTIRARSRNVNGITGYTDLTTKLQVHTASASGFLETSIPVSDSLGNGYYTDDAVRIFDFASATTDTPSFSASTDFYTNSLWSEASDPGIQGTREAVVRFGTLQHYTTDLSSGYLPVGPDLSTGRSGAQYFTFAFRRRVVANFDIAINGTVAGVWYACPGTTLTAASGLNGWVEGSSQYAGVGLPGTDTGNGGNGLPGGAYTGSDVIPLNTSISSSYTMTLGTANMSNATGNVVLVRVALTSGQTINSLSIGVAS